MAWTGMSTSIFLFRQQVEATGQGTFPSKEVEANSILIH